MEGQWHQGQLTAHFGSAACQTGASETLPSVKKIIQHIGKGEKQTVFLFHVGNLVLIVGHLFIY